MEKKQTLTGEWDFHFTATPLAELDFGKIEFTEKKSVPGCFDAKGKYRFQRGCGIYRTLVSCGGNVKLEVGAAGLRADVYFDRKKIGSMLKPFTAETFVFDAGTPGRHELLIATENTFDESPSSLFQPNYDFYAYGGIYREVTLTELPQTWIENANLIPLDLETGCVELRLELGGDWNSIREMELQFDAEEPFMLPVDAPRMVLRRNLCNKETWSPETPKLHHLQIRGCGETRTVAFGLRTAGVRDGKITLNGREIKLIGFNRHDAHPDYGYAIPRELTRADLELLKNAGYNFVRGSHYPQSEAMLDMCDELGLLVWDESLGWGNKIDSLIDPVFSELQQQQTRQMVRRSINHPCIILWGFLNESESNQPGSEKLIKTLVETIKEEDPSRLVTFATDKHHQDRCLDYPDVISFNTYPGWYYPRTLDQEFSREAVLENLNGLAELVSQERYRHKGLLIGEIGAAALPGDHSGLRWSEEYQAELLMTVLEEVMRSDRWSGVAFWQFCDTKTYSDVRSLMRPRGFNNKGVITEYRAPKQAWFKLAEMLKSCKLCK